MHASLRRRRLPVAGFDRLWELVFDLFATLVLAVFDETEDDHFVRGVETLRDFFVGQRLVIGERRFVDLGDFDLHVHRPATLGDTNYTHGTAPVDQTGNSKKFVEIVFNFLMLLGGSASPC
jgi:hypothetical protein